MNYDKDPCQTINKTWNVSQGFCLRCAIVQLITPPEFNIPKITRFEGRYMLLRPIIFGIHSFIFGLTSGLTTADHQIQRSVCVDLDGQQILGPRKIEMGWLRPGCQPKATEAKIYSAVFFHTPRKINGWFN